jgi:CheY-like chemotaxis protein
MNALRVLLVEDDALIGMLLADMLTGVGHAICEIAVTEAEAIAAAAQHRPDLMIVDVGLGRGSGVVAMEQILRDWYVPHLYMTGNVARIAVLRQHAVVLEKPFREPALLLAMQCAMDVARMHRP